MVRSKGEAELDKALKRLFPHDTVLQDWPIKVRGTTLYVDRVIKTHMLAIEVDGRQHGEFSPYHHKNAAGFGHAKKLDVLKRAWLEDNGYRLIRFSHDEEITADSVRDKYLEAIQEETAS